MKQVSLICITVILATAWLTVDWRPTQALEPAKEPAKAGTGAGEPQAEEPQVWISPDRGEIVMPGMRILIKKGCVDVDAKVCLTEGMLELIACTKDSKEHEAIIAIEPRAKHVHAALLLIGAQPGNPAMTREIQTADGPRWLDLPPRGQEIDLYLVFKNKAGEMEERPINQFIIRGRDESITGELEPEDEENREDRAFPTHTFLFVGSRIFKDGKNDPVYLADKSGNVISLATFGDELLCLPGVHGHDNEGLVWAVDPTHLPELDSQVILRLKPKKTPAAEQSRK